MSEHGIQNEIRNALAGECVLFRANVGTGWTGTPVRVPPGTAVRLNAGDMVLRNARPFSTGLPPGFSDTFGLKSVTITADMVGEKIAVAVFGEIKSDDGKTTPKQDAFLRAMMMHGARAGIWRTVEDALRTVRGQKEL